MDHFALLPAAERATVFPRGRRPLAAGFGHNHGKGFLGLLDASESLLKSDSAGTSLFKGGTSLSKRLSKVIERFSEDVDIVLNRHALGFTGDHDPPNIAGTNKRNRKLDELAGKCSGDCSGRTVHEELKNSFRLVLGQADWKITVDPADADRQSLLFAYPLGLEADLYGLGTYIRPVIRLEFGCRGDVWPSEQQSIQPWVSLTHFLACWLSRPRKSTYFALNAHSGRRQRHSMPFTIRARWQPRRSRQPPWRPLPIVPARIRAACDQGCRPARKCSRAQEGFLPRSCSAVRSGQAKPGSLRVCPPESPRCTDSKRLPGHVRGCSLLNLHRLKP